jgi:hypothetical protein
MPAGKPVLVTFEDGSTVEYPTVSQCSSDLWARGYRYKSEGGLPLPIHADRISRKWMKGDHLPQYGPECVWKDDAYVTVKFAWA